MKMYEIFHSELVKDNTDLKEKLHSLIEKHYSHLRHSLRGEIPIDAFLVNEIFKIMDGVFKIVI